MGEGRRMGMLAMVAGRCACRQAEPPCGWQAQGQNRKVSMAVQACVCTGRPPTTHTHAINSTHPPMQAGRWQGKVAGKAQGKGKAGR